MTERICGNCIEFDGLTCDRTGWKVDPKGLGRDNTGCKRWRKEDGSEQQKQGQVSVSVQG